MAQFSINSSLMAEIDVKKSRFLAYLFPANEFAARMSELREEHVKARHFVYAYRLLNPDHQIVENLSDDGEPKGSSAKPCLNVLRGAMLIDTAVIVVRYFGGIKLGVGGLVRAYSDSVNNAIKVAREEDRLVEYIPMIELKLFIPFSNLARVEHLLKSVEHRLLERSFEGEGVQMHLSIAEAQLTAFKESISHHQYGKVIEEI